jgi:ParB family chromosome partitioning protein
MGRGLAAILSVSSTDVADADLRNVPVAEIAPNPKQPRTQFDDAALAALAGSLEERGVLQPVLVRERAGGGYELIAGERRWRAAQLAGLAEIPAIVREADDAASLELALIENMAREDLNPVEEARACAALVEELGLTREAVGRRIGRSRVAVSNLLRLLDLPEEVLGLLESGALSEGHGRAVLMAKDHDARRRLAAAAAEQGWSVRALEQRAREAEEGAPAKRPGKGSRVALHPDLEHALAEVSDQISGALGVGATAAPGPKGGCRVTLSFDSLDDARALAKRLDTRRAA